MRRVTSWGPRTSRHCAVVGISILLLVGGLAFRSSTAPPPTGGPATPADAGATLLQAARESLLAADGASGPNRAPHPAGGSNLTGWHQIVTVTAPSPRAGAMMVYDASDGYVLLFGGGGPPSGGGWYELGDTWTFSNGTWTNITANLTVSPSPRSDGGMVYDPVLQQVVLFGGQSGFDGGTVLNDTWTYHAGAWVEVVPPRSPSVRTSPSMTWDNSSDEVVLFGGCANVNCTTVLNDTWTFQLGDWTNATVSPSPPARGGAGFTYDAAAGEDILFGGLSPTTRFNDTWVYKGTNWTNATGTAGPSPRVYPFLEYDAASSTAILYGGEDYGVFNAETWSFAPSTWTDLTSALSVNPGTLGRGAMTYDPVNRTLLLFGGLSSTSSATNGFWQLEAAPLPVPVQVTVEPSGCGPIEIGYGNPVANGTSALLSEGSYPVVAPPCSGYAFSSWSFSGGVEIPVTEWNFSAANLTLTGAGTLTATYLAAYPVVFDVRPATCGPISVSPYGPVPVGGNVTLTVGDHPIVAPPCAGHVFDHWAGAGGAVVSSATANISGAELLVTGSGTLTAVYVPLLSVQFVVQPAGCGPIEVSTGISEPNGGTLPLRNGTYFLLAPACSGHVFGSWSVTGGLSIPSGYLNSSGAPLVVTGPGIVTAEYSALYPVLFDVTPSSCGLEAVATPGGVVDGGTIPLANGTYLVSAPDCIGYQFDHWGSTGSVSVPPVSTFLPSASVAVDGGPGTITAVFTPLYSIQFIVQPTLCGAVRVGVTGGVSTNGVALLANGTYLIEAPGCNGYSFQSWETAGDVSIPAAESGTATAELTVAGVGIATAAYTINVSGPVHTSGGGSNWYAVTTFGILLGLVVGAAAGSLAAFAILRRRREGRRTAPRSPS